MAVPRVMFVNHTSTIAGAEMVLLDLVRPWRMASAFLFEDGPLNRAMDQRGLHVITSRWGGGLAAIRRDGSLWNAAPLAYRLCAVIKEIVQAARRHDLIYANSQKAFVLAAFAAAIARRPLVWHLHDIIDDAHFGSLQRRLQVTLANRLAARVIVPSRAAASAFVAAGGRKSLVAIVPNGIGAPIDAPIDTPARDAIRTDLALPNSPLVGVFSRLAPWKGQHVVLNAIAALPDVHALIVGDALFGERAYADSLAVLAATLGIADRVHFLGHRNDVTRLMKAVDVMVHPSVHPEPFGRTLVEAMLAKVPVIATDTGAASDILDAGKAGLLVPPNDADTLARGIAGVLADAQALSGQLVYAAERARRLYDVEQMSRSVADVITRVAAGAGA
ncbi:MAG: glycosyltransferase family 4 protein [Hyphomicrobiales bacterium]|nr:glycosyltransferase family 4 protein [Hyphomicrobiales bacterium]